MLMGLAEKGATVKALLIKEAGGVNSDGVPRHLEQHSTITKEGQTGIMVLKRHIDGITNEIQTLQSMIKERIAGDAEAVERLGKIIVKSDEITPTPLLTSNLMQLEGSQQNLLLAFYATLNVWADVLRS
jgi:hypothetical protein